MGSHGKHREAIKGWRAYQGSHGKLREATKGWRAYQGGTANLGSTILLSGSRANLGKSSKAGLHIREANLGSTILSERQT